MPRTHSGVCIWHRNGWRNQGWPTFFLEKRLGASLRACADGPPTGTRIWEISRFCLDPAQTPAERRDARNQLVTALADHALHNGISDYVGIAEAGWYHSISKFGWACRTLGPVHRDRNCRIVALRIAIDDDTIPGLKRTGTYAPLMLKFEEGGEPAL